MRWLERCTLSSRYRLKKIDFNGAWDAPNTCYKKESDKFMTIVTSEELSKFRNSLQSYGEDASKILDIVEECHGNLEEAMEILMVNAGKEPVLGDDNWIDFENIAKGLRNFICDPKFKNFLVNEDFSMALGYLLGPVNLPIASLILVLLFITKKGIRHFCEQEQRT